MQTSAIHSHANGGPEFLEVVSVEVGEPAPGELRIRQSAIGLNFSDIYQRRGAHGPYAPAPFPVTLGGQGSGVVDAVGAGVDDFHGGQSVTYIHPGAYQAVRNVPASRVIALPDHISEEVAGATLLRGLTAEYLLRRLYVVKPGDAMLIHAAAGGSGVILSQWARALGATVIGTVGADAKIATALAHGCHHVINYGTASDDVEGFELQRLHAKSLSVSRPTFRTFIAETAQPHCSRSRAAGRCASRSIAATRCPMFGARTRNWKAAAPSARRCCSPEDTAVTQDHGRPGHCQAGTYASRRSNAPGPGCTGLASA
jgi:NADPH2:quinone reductase